MVSPAALETVPLPVVFNPSRAVQPTISKTGENEGWQEQPDRFNCPSNPIVSCHFENASAILRQILNLSQVADTNAVPIASN